MNHEFCFIKSFESIDDPRIDRAKKHSLVDILTITICAVVAGAEGWEHIELFGKAKIDWFKTFLQLPNGIPSHDTFARVFARLDPHQIHACLLDWTSQLQATTKGQAVAIDGKTLRRSFDTASGKAAIHMVSAWATQSRVVLGQVKTDQKSNEITAIPKLLELLELEGAIVSLDAMGCQKRIAAKIREKRADYVLALKSNHPDLHQEVKALFNIARKKDFFGMAHDCHQDVDAGHGRIETRSCRCLPATEWFPLLGQEWEGIQTLAMVESLRETKDKTQTEVRYYLSSLPLDAARLAYAVRSHWGIENSLHWVLDMTFREDDSRVRKDNAPENLAMVRRLALNLIKKVKPEKVSFKASRLLAKWDLEFVKKAIFAG